MAGWHLLELRDYGQNKVDLDIERPSQCSSLGMGHSLHGLRDQLDTARHSLSWALPDLCWPLNQRACSTISRSKSSALLIQAKPSTTTQEMTWEKGLYESKFFFWNSTAILCKNNVESICKRFSFYCHHLQEIRGSMTKRWWNQSSSRHGTRERGAEA